jgi:long-chain acyl-CoA synthetase
LPLDVGTTSSEIRGVARQFGVAALVQSTPQPILGFHEPRPFSRALWISTARVDPGASRFGDAVVLKMTSGTTGVPRAALTPESSLVHDSRTLMHAMDIGPDDVQVAAIPLSHAYGLGNLLVPALIQGSPLVMREAFVPQRLTEDARAYGARVYPGVPFMFDHFATNPPDGGWPPTLRCLISAGAPLARTVADTFLARFHVKVHSFYGTSETGGIAYDDSDGPAGDGLVGRPLPGVTVTLVPQDGAPSGGGRIHVAGPAVIGSYADGVDADVFVDGGFLTGDLGVLNAAGELTLTGRLSAFVNVAGRKVQPDEVERVLRRFDGVRDVRVVGVADPRRGEHLVAGLVVHGTQPSVLSLRRFCGVHLAPHKIPRAFVFLDDIPTTARGKTDRQRLAALLNDALQQQDGVL